MAKKKAKKKWIKKAIKNPGSLTKTAMAHDMTVNQMMAHPPMGISTTTRRRIAVAKTLKRLRSK